MQKEIQKFNRSKTQKRFIGLGMKESRLWEKRHFLTLGQLPKLFDFFIKVRNRPTKDGFEGFFPTNRFDYGVKIFEQCVDVRFGKQMSDGPCAQLIAHTAARVRVFDN